jgi:uncharacterized protein (UPF0332 family)
MLDRKKAREDYSQHLADGLLKKERNETAKVMYVKNADISIQLADECMTSELKPHMWVVVISYYSMFYIANAVLLELGYRTGDRLVHKVTNDALIVLVTDRVRDGLLDEYEDAKDEALAIARAEEIVGLYGLERGKRSRLQYEMTESVKKEKAATSLLRAKRFLLEMKKLLRQ